MLEESDSIPFSLTWTRMPLSRTGESGRALAPDLRKIGVCIGTFLCAAEWQILLLCPFFVALTISSRAEDLAVGQVSLPIQIVGNDGTTESRTVVVPRVFARDVVSRVGPPRPVVGVVVLPDHNPLAGMSLMAAIGARASGLACGFTGWGAAAKAETPEGRPGKVQQVEQNAQKRPDSFSPELLKVSVSCPVADSACLC